MTSELVPVGAFDASAARSPRVDVVVAVHDLTRPVGRAVASAVGPAAGSPTGSVRVTVACHELGAARVANVLDPRLGSSVRLLEVRDGLGSPSGPFNAGFDAATAPFVSIIGSDDFFEPGALRAWTDRAEATGADVVMARLRAQSGSGINTPRARPFRSSRLDPVKDRLAYRTAPLGLLRRATLDRHALRLDSGVKVGGDLALGLRLWALADRVELGRQDPAYVIGEDAVTRVTTTPRPLTVTLAPYESLLAQTWFARMPRAYRRAVAIKVLRIHVLGAVVARGPAGSWSAAETAYLHEVARGLVQVERGVLRPFSVADRVLLDACLDPRSDAGRIVTAVARRAQTSRTGRLLPPNPLHALDREGTLRYFVADRFWR
ncbi:glycosyltransferase [Cellulosimicrobium sp. NPDC055967]|uniref:glycosyltransferase n=1 Tax=Cellulosimicrobium sp. NPDC055967 TaxID=3345670 RepID=UPI0035D5AFA3